MIRLAFALALPRGKEAAARLIITAMGLALGVMLLLFAAVAFPALHAHEVRGAWLRTTAGTSPLRPGPAGAGQLLWRRNTDYFEGRPITWVDEAALGPGAPVPPGLSQLPGPGQLAVSPALGALLRSTPPAMLADRFAGKVIEQIGDAGLTGPGQLVAVVGHRATVLRPLGGVGTVRTLEAAVPGLGLTATGFLRLMVVIGLIGLLVPVMVFVATATRLAAARREQRLAALRLAGATPGQAAVVAAIEAVAAALVGDVLGFAAFAAARPQAARIPVDGNAFFISDLRLPAATGAAIALGVPLLAAATAVVCLRRVRSSPLGVTRGSARARPSGRRLIPLVTGLAGFGAALALEASVHGDSNVPLGAVALAFIVVIIGIVIAGPLLTAGVGRGIARLGRRAPSLMAARHLEADPAAAFRAISGLVLATFVATVISGVTPSVLSSSGRGYTPFPPGLVAQQFAARYLTPHQPPLSPAAAARLTRVLSAVPGVTGVTGLRLPPPGSVRLGAGTYNLKYGLQPVLTRCADLRADQLGRCPDPDATVAVDGSTISNGELGGPTITLLRPVRLAALPLVAVVVATDGRPGAIERVRTILDAGSYGQTGPALASADVNVRSNEQLARLEQLANAGLLLTLLIAGCSLAVAVAAGLTERQRPFALLRLAGMHPSDLSRTVLAETAIPLLAMAVASVLLGLGVSAALLLAVGHGSHLVWKAPPLAYWAALGGGLLLALAIIAATLPLLHRLTSAGSVRFE